MYLCPRVPVSVFIIKRNSQRYQNTNRGKHPRGEKTVSSYYITTSSRCSLCYQWETRGHRLARNKTHIFGLTKTRSRFPNPALVEKMATLLEEFVKQLMRNKQHEPCQKTINHCWVGSYESSLKPLLVVVAGSCASRAQHKHLPWRAEHQCSTA